jgi:hypothetical protein
MIHSRGSPLPNTSFASLAEASGPYPVSAPWPPVLVGAVADARHGMRSGSIYGRSPSGEGALQWSDNQSVAAVYPAFDAACAAGLDEVRGSAPNYLGGHLRPVEPTGLADPGPTGCHHDFVRPRAAETEAQRISFDELRAAIQAKISASSGRESFPLRRAIQIVDAETQVRT